jgi:hypothetical protein
MHVQINHDSSPVEPVPEMNSLTGKKVIVDLQDYVAIIKKNLIVEHIEPGAMSKACSAS